MRCPRCGYISFDQVNNCLRCGKDIKKVSRELEGAVSNVAAPGYLAFAQEEAARAQAESRTGEKAEELVAVLPEDDFFLDDSSEELEAEESNTEIGGVDLSKPQTPVKREEKSASSDKEIDIDFGELGLGLEKDDVQ